ncbi:hypothetical protein BJ508DRAFT_411973 [Ascobolus immersus RN42]|uniref:Uncharacterized protein n=1 Tax=Ascobolus immersus RN42 TaxID=1160509 RepID=A0A3N4IVE0_ASCIM|nr:hypothetical protein BJ508DRAFT_411973 [Ascobolus immersus RN42]
MKSSSTQHLALAPPHRPNPKQATKRHPHRLLKIPPPTHQFNPPIKSLPPLSTRPWHSSLPPSNQWTHPSLCNGERGAAAKIAKNILAALCGTNR